MPKTMVCTKAAIYGEIDAPVSKSSQQRAIACALLSDGISEIYSQGRDKDLCADSRAALALATALGAEVLIEEGRIRIKGSKWFLTQRKTQGVADVDRNERVASCGESGLCMRMFSPIVALLHSSIILEATGSLCKRSMYMVEATLRSLGVICTSLEGFAPLHIQGPLEGGSFHIDASESSQLLTGLLMALPCVKKDSIILVNNPVSMGYIDLTIDTCKAFGVNIHKNQSHTEFRIEGRQKYLPTNFFVEGDWSGAAFLIVAAAIGNTRSMLKIHGLSTRSSQPDRAVLEAVVNAGARIDVEKDSISVYGTDRLGAFDFDATNCPDLFPPLSILAAACVGRSIIHGIGRLTAKESDRAASIVALLQSIGIKVALRNDSMIIEGGTIAGGIVKSCGDHRIAMAAAIAATIAEAPIVIEDPDCVSKSWPGFFNSLQSVFNPQYSF